MNNENILHARTALLMNDTVYGICAAQLQIVESTDHKSFTVDGKYLYVDMDEVLSVNTIAAKIKEGISEFISDGVGTEHYENFKVTFLNARTWSEQPKPNSTGWNANTIRDSIKKFKDLSTRGSTNNA